MHGVGYEMTNQSSSQHNFRNQLDPSNPRPQSRQSPEGDMRQPVAAATPSQQSMMQDMFVENYRRPSSRLGGGEAEEDPDRIEVA